MSFVYTGTDYQHERTHMIFRQLFESLSSTYTYLLGCEQTGQALLIDPVITEVERDLAEIQRLGLILSYSVETHIHADHITGALELKKQVGSKIAGSAFDGLPCTEFGIEEGKPFQLGSITLQPLYTPGHTDSHSHTYAETECSRVTPC